VDRRRGGVLRALGRPLSSGSDDPNFSFWDPALRPSALYISTNIRSSAGATYNAGVPRGGYVTLDYGESGNVTQMIVHSQCVDVSNARRCADPRASSFTARRTALETNCRCAEEQRYVYDWDELNRVAEARRYERHGTGGWPLAVQQRYFYDAGNVRMVKETVDFGRVNEGASFNATTLYPYPGDYERRGVTLDFAGSTYNASPTLGTETQYLVGGARLVWASNQPGSGNLTREQRLTLPLSDLVQSTAAVVDLQSGELLEHTTFYPNGARETHRTTDEVSLQLEPIGFTGKEADEEVGLVYFGERYLIPRLGRWASVDPLSVHAVGGGEALNGYHYVLIEELLGGNLPNSFRTIDRVVGSDLAAAAIHSIKSMDLTTSSWRNISRMNRKIREFHRRSCRVFSRTGSGRTVSAGADTTRVLEVAVERGAANEAQQNLLVELSEYAESRGVEMVIREVK
jgi:RHS repeat-associated protein